MSTKDDTFAVLNGLKPIEKDDGGDLIPIDQFRNASLSFSFVDYDGIGYWATDKYHLCPGLSDIDSSAWANPSHFLNKDFKPPHWATHVLWYNK